MKREREDTETFSGGGEEVAVVRGEFNLEHHMAAWARLRNKMEHEYKGLRDAGETSKGNSRMRDLRDSLALIASQMHAARIELDGLRARDDDAGDSFRRKAAGRVMHMYNTSGLLLRMSHSVLFSNSRERERILKFEAGDVRGESLSATYIRAGLGVSTYTDGIGFLYDSAKLDVNAAFDADALTTKNETEYSELDTSSRKYKRGSKTDFARAYPTSKFGKHLDYTKPWGVDFPEHTTAGMMYKVSKMQADVVRMNEVMIRPKRQGKLADAVVGIVLGVGLGTGRSIVGTSTERNRRLPAVHKEVETVFGRPLPMFTYLPAAGRLQHMQFGMEMHKVSRTLFIGVKYAATVEHVRDVLKDFGAEIDTFAVYHCTADQCVALEEMGFTSDGATFPYVVLAAERTRVRGCHNILHYNPRGTGENAHLLSLMPNPYLLKQHVFAVVDGRELPCAAISLLVNTATGICDVHLFCNAAKTPMPAIKHVFDRAIAFAFGMCGTVNVTMPVKEEDWRVVKAWMHESLIASDRDKTFSSSPLTMEAPRAGVALGGRAVVAASTGSGASGAFGDEFTRELVNNITAELKVRNDKMSNYLQFYWYFCKSLEKVMFDVDRNGVKTLKRNAAERKLAWATALAARMPPYYSYATYGPKTDEELARLVYARFYKQPTLASCRKEPYLNLAVIAGGKRYYADPYGRTVLPKGVPAQCAAIEMPVAALKRRPGNYGQPPAWVSTLKAEGGWGGGDGGGGEYKKKTKQEQEAEDASVRRLEAQFANAVVPTTLPTVSVPNRVALPTRGGRSYRRRWE
jgi:hypothetical protein